MKLTEEQKKKIEEVFKPYSLINDWGDGLSFYSSHFNHFVIRRDTKEEARLIAAFKFKSVKF